MGNSPANWCVRNAGNGSAWRGGADRKTNRGQRRNLAILRNLFCKMLRGAWNTRAYAGCNELLPEACTRHGKEVPILHAVNETAPDDFVRKKTSDPDNKTDGIPQWYKPEPLPCSGIMQPPPSGRPRQAESEQEVSKEMSHCDSRPSRSSRHHRCK